jgi:hypothetical protein
MTEPELPDQEEEPDEEISYFVGECTCDHEMEDHGLGCCDMEGCECTAGWEE